jgi:hypothetical protein
MNRVFVLTACLVLGACTQIGTKIGNNYRAELAPLLRAESGSVDDVLAAMGPPHRVAAAGAGYLFLYHHYDIEEDQIGVSSDLPFLNWFKLSLASAEAEELVTVLGFDDQDQLVAVSHWKDLEELGQAGSMTLAIQFSSIIDSSRITTEPWPINNWGKSLLKPLPAMLNDPYAPDSGGAGLELRDTPARVGQRTLE